MASRTQRNIGKSHGQRVPPLIKVIINTLRNYPDGSQILKELIQNADDACATEVEFLLDEAHHNTEHLIHPDVGKYQGPALYAWNNALFEEEDWEGIRDIGVSRKEKKVLKVGRFALGFISVYHITDFPCILSNNDVLLLDPQMLIDTTGGLIIGLKEFISDDRVGSHFESFFNYFGYKGTNHYAGTIFRLPLRTGSYETLLPNTVYDTKKVLCDLFGPFRQEIENCLLFMKSVRTVRVSVKDSTGIRLLYSAEVDNKFSERLDLHRKEMSEFIENGHYLQTSSIFISIFPTSIIDCNQAKIERLWLVMNMLGITGNSQLNESSRFDSYLPWYAIALPLPHSQLTLDALNNQNCWSQAFTDTTSFFKFIEKHIPIIPLSCELLNFVGNLFCFLPIPATSKFPFHIHGYFALSTNRRSIKWPRYDDLSDEAKWNKELVENLGTVSYAVLLYLMISRFHTQERSGFHYSLWSCLPSRSETDELQFILHSRALDILKNSKLVCCELDSTWLELINGYYLPSLFGRTIPHENVCHELLLNLSQPLVELTPGVAQVITNYEFLMQNVSKRIVTPDLIRQILIRFKNDNRILDFLREEQNVCALLEVVLYDLKIPSKHISNALDGIRLIPVHSSDLPMFFGIDTYFISEGSSNFLKIFPGLERNFVKSSLPHHVNKSLLKLSRTGNINIQDISNIKPQTFITLLQRSMKTFFNLNCSIKWSPGINNQPEKTWIKQVWKSIDQDHDLITALKNNKMPLLPKQDLDANEIDLLPLSTATGFNPYLEHSTVPAHQEIENLIASSGGQICHRHQFILPFNLFVLPPIPSGLFSLLKSQAIHNKFLRTISNADNSIRQSLIKLILSALLNNNDEIYCIKSFPIFISMSNDWTPLDPRRSYYLPPDILPHDFNSYPPKFLNPFNQQNKELCSKVGVVTISLDETIQHHLFPLISSNTLCNQPKERNQLSLWILRNYSLFDNNVVSMLSTTKWLLDSSVNYNQSLKKNLYFSPAELFDPQDALISRLVPPSVSQHVRGIFPSELYHQHINTLKCLGLMSSSSRNLTYLNFQNVIRVALQNIGKVNPGDFEIWFKSLVDFISLHIHGFNLYKADEFWSIFKKTAFIFPASRNQCSNYPECLPFFTRPLSLFKPSETILCSDKDSCLIAGVSPFLVDKSDSSKDHWEVYRLMGFQTNIPVHLVCQQLTLTTKQKDVNHYQIHSFVKKIYKYFARVISLNKDQIKSINLPTKFIYIPEFGFYDCQHVVKSCDETLFPYIFSLEKYYPTYEENIYQFFKTFRIQSEVGFSQCQFVLQRLQSKPLLSQNDVILSIKLIQISADSIQNLPTKKNCLILAEDCRIYSSVQCVFNDLPWLTRSQILTDKPVVHSRISNSIADHFGCFPASSQMTPTAESISYSFMSNAGQKENLVKRLKSILDGYRVQSDVFLELIQNSDDAGAKQVKILFDYTSHPSTSVLSKNMERVHGPALYLFNDSKFTPRDFDSILEISSGNKLNDTTKIGRFGVGFNAVYNFTDCPSFVSDSSVQIFDPLRKYIGPISQDSGVRLCFTNDEVAISTYQDQFKVYHGIFDCNILNREPYKYTLFRLPFRVTPSKLSSKTYNNEEIARIQANLLQELPQLILFLQNVASIEIYEKKEVQLPFRKLLTVSKSECPTTHFLVNNIHYFETYLKRVKDKLRPAYVVKSSDELSVCSKSPTGEVTTQKFLISYASGIQECFDVLRKFNDSDITFLPLCGVAIPLSFTQTSDHSQYNIYTFLPLPIMSPLLLHINGCFSLSSSRKNLSDFEKPGSGESSDLRTDWNLALINDALSNALINALEVLPRLEPLSSGSQLEHIANYYSLWPVRNNSNFLWKKFYEFFVRRIIDYFPTAQIFSCAHEPSTWVAFDQISFLSLKENIRSKSDFIQLIYKLANQIGIKFANFPPSFTSTMLYLVFSELKPEKIFDLGKICELVIFPKLNELTLENLVLVFNSLTPLCIDDSENWLLNSLCKTAFIPCGSNDSDFILRVPSRVVCPNTRITPLYKEGEMRIPVPKLHDKFDLSKPDIIPNVLKRMHVIYNRLVPECEVISRCEITSELSMEFSTRHASILIKYLSQEEDSYFQSVYPKIQSIPFIPTYKDDLLGPLSITHTRLTSPNKCYAYSCRDLVSPLYLCVPENLSRYFLSPKFSISSTPTLDIVLRVLETLISKSQPISEGTLNINERILEIYKFLSKKVAEKSNLAIVKNRVENAAWIWHPDYRQFYTSNQVVLSPEFRTFSENKYIISFPYTDSLRDENFKTFLINLGVREKIDDSIITKCLERIQQEFKLTPLHPNLVLLVLKLIESIENCHDCSEKIFILNRINILHRPRELYIHLSSHLEQEDSKQLVHFNINYTRALQLGAKTSEELFSKNTDFDESDFGVEEEITDRIQSLVRDIPMNAFINELIQNSDDAEATEIVFILDEQDYSSFNETLSLPEREYPNWKYLHSFPSLSVYNNKGFSEEDFRGIQTLSVGGKTHNRKSIGKFGIGFNSVYQITDTPTFITSQPGSEVLTFCCIDPFIKYTVKSSETGESRKKRGKRFDIPRHNIEKFSDQLLPFQFTKFRDDPKISQSLANLWNSSEFTMFRFPLDIESSSIKQNIPYRKGESRKRCPFNTVMDIITNHIKNSSEILLFLNHVQSMKVISIDRYGELKLEYSQTFRVLEEMSKPTPSYFPHSRIARGVKIQKKECVNARATSRGNAQVFLIYSFPDVSIDQYVAGSAELVEFSGKYNEEKLWGYGGIAICISPFKRATQSNIFTFLPFTRDKYPVHINAPLIFDASRQHLNTQSSSWVEAWHSSIIKCILAPLYTMLVLDLRQPFKPVDSVQDKRGYFEWFYHLFPGKSKTHQFLVKLSEEFYSFLYKTNQSILLCDNLEFSDELKWYSLHGDNCGVLKPIFFPTTSSKTQEVSPSNIKTYRHEVSTPYLLSTFHAEMPNVSSSPEKERSIREALILIQFPLSFAPTSLFDCFNEFKMVRLDQSLLLNYLRDNIDSLFRENSYPCNIKGSLLNFRQFNVILDYILTSNDELFRNFPIIPLRIDIGDNVRCFRKDKPSYRHKFHTLIPHCSESFISSKYDNPSIILHRLSSLGYVHDLSCDYLAKHLDIGKFEGMKQYCLFWEFVVESKLSEEDLNKFYYHSFLDHIMFHALVPIISSEPSQTFFAINDLKFVISETLNDVSNDQTLFNALQTLGCPSLSFDFFSKHTNSKLLTIRIKSYFDKIAISQTRPAETILGSLSFSSKLSAVLCPEEAYKLFQIISQLNIQKCTDGQLRIISELKIFKTHSEEHLALSQCDICFMNNENLVLGPTILRIIQVHHKLVIFQSYLENFLEVLCTRLKKELIDVNGLLLKYIFTHLCEIPFREQSKIIKFISQRLAGGNPKLQGLTKKLAEVPFIIHENRSFKVSELYSPSLLFVKTFLRDRALPEEWDKKNFKQLFSELGLREEICLEDILIVTWKINRGELELPPDSLLFLLTSLVSTLSIMDFSHMAHESVMCLRKIAEVSFLPAWMIENVNSNQKSYSPHLVRFCDAQLDEFQYCCSTTALIHDLTFGIPEKFYKLLNIAAHPNPELMKQHLIIITNQVMHQHPQLADLPDELNTFFKSTYENLEKYSDKYKMNFDEFHDLQCILFGNNLYSPINVLFTSSEELEPFVLQLPPSLASRCPNFLENIGVEKKASYKHFAYVLLKIQAHLQTQSIELSASNYLIQAERVFNSLINILRELESSSTTPPNLDLSQIMLLANDSKLFPCVEVIFGDNPLLLSRVTKLQLQFNILKPLEPDQSKSCVPPACLKLRRLTEFVSEEIDPNVYNNMVISLGSNLSNNLQDKLKSPIVLRAMRRLYFHLTKKDLETLLLKNGETCIADSKPHPGFLSVSQLFNNLQIVCVNQIDLLIEDSRQTPPMVHQISNSSAAFIDANSKLLISNHPLKQSCIYKDISYAINAYLGNIFTEVLSFFELCFMLDPAELMEKLNEYNIIIDPWPIPHLPVPTIPTAPALAPIVPVTIPTTISPNYATPTYVPVPRPRPRPRGISFGEPDIPAAKLWLMVSQCDRYAAEHLMTPSPNKQHLFPGYACFCCFEAVIKAFIALLHYKGSKERLVFERNLRVHLDHLPFVLPHKQQLYSDMEQLTIPLMNYDAETRVPSATPGMGCYFPQQIFTRKQAKEAIRNATQLIGLIVDEIPEMRDIILTKDNPILKCLPSPKPPLITAILTFNVGEVFGKTYLAPDSEDFFAVSRCFYASMPYSEIISIHKIYNPTSWNAFKQNIIQETNIHPESCLYIRSLFHGSRNTNPEVIINDPEGFKIKSESRGLWGRGIYFATNCSYSHDYKYSTGDGLSCVFLATVFVGYAKELPESRSITAPPMLPNNSTYKYHSVLGRRGGEEIHIVYKNCMAYPSFLITYRD